MKIDPKIEALKAEATAWRRDIHAHPEIQYDVQRTAGKVADLLKTFGVDEIVTGIGQTGVVGVIRGKTSASGKIVGLRADMDALPMDEQTNLPHASRNAGKMHACGHDGHTAMLLGAAKHLAATRDFDGTAVVIFQPAEEGGAGARAMLQDGLAERFGIQKFFGMHNLPGLPVGEFGITPGPAMAATATFDILIEGKGAHGAMPHTGIDPVVIASQMVSALQTIAARSTDPLKSVVVSVTAINAGSTYNVIPGEAALKGTIRYFDKGVGQATEERFRAIVDMTARMFGATARLEYRHGYPVTFNHAEETGIAVDAARRIAQKGAESVTSALPPMMGAEDFSFMLEARPGAMIFIGNGDSAPLHNPGFDFNDNALPFGIAYWNQVVQETMPATAG